MDEVTAHLAAVYRDRAGSDSGLLEAAFGRTRFVYLRRGDVVAQAVSLLRAEQTGVWFETADERQEPAGEPVFDFGQVRDLVRQVVDHNAAWKQWFTAQVGIRPYTVLHEELDADPVRIASGVLGFLGLALPAGRRSSSGTSASPTRSTPGGSKATASARYGNGSGPNLAFEFAASPVGVSRSESSARKSPELPHVFDMQLAIDPLQCLGCESLRLPYRPRGGLESPV